MAGRQINLIEVESDVRAKNQVTIPKPIAEALGLRAGDRLVFVVREGEKDHVHLYRVPPSFAGIAPHGYGGDQQDSKEYIRGERGAWVE